MKTTIEIADDLFLRVQKKARKEKKTFRAVTEQALRLILKDEPPKKRKLPPIPTVKGWLTDEYKNKSLSEIIHESYRGHGT